MDLPFPFCHVAFEYVRINSIHHSFSFIRTLQVMYRPIVWRWPTIIYRSGHHSDPVSTFDAVLPTSSPTLTGTPRPSSGNTTLLLVPPCRICLSLSSITCRASLELHHQYHWTFHCHRLSPLRIWRRHRSPSRRGFQPFGRTRTCRAIGKG
jgi:hypothetical protein